MPGHCWITCTRTHPSTKTPPPWQNKLTHEYTDSTPSQWWRALAHREHIPLIATAGLHAANYSITMEYYKKDWKKLKNKRKKGKANYRGRGNAYFLKVGQQCPVSQGGGVQRNRFVGMIDRLLRSACSLPALGFTPYRFYLPYLPRT